MIDPIAAHQKLVADTLATGKPVYVSQFIESYRQMAPMLHRHLKDNWLDFSPLNYAMTRLPSVLPYVNQIILTKEEKMLESVKK